MTSAPYFGTNMHIVHVGHFISFCCLWQVTESWLRFTVDMFQQNQINDCFADSAIPLLCHADR